jgi:electron transport complex protein RnfG
LNPRIWRSLDPNWNFKQVSWGFALIASVLLGVTNCSTEGAIQRRLDEDLKKSLKEVVPAALYDNDMLQDTLHIPSAEYNLGANETTVYIAKKSGQVTAVCFKFTAPDGYSGAINMIMGIDRDGNVLGVRVLSHKETPGLDDKIEVAKSDWTLNFDGRSPGQFGACEMGG